jgi:hypothetical protein
VQPHRTSEYRLPSAFDRITEDFRGRDYIGPVLENDQDGGTITTSYSNILAAFAQSVSNSYNSNPFAWVVYSRKLKTSQAVIAVHIRLFIATQRRRSRYNPG